MKPTIEILENIGKNSQQNKNEVFTRLYRYMLRPDIYYVAYKNLYANKGASTKGIDNDTADGFCERQIQNVIRSLKQETYMPKPAKRTYIRKANGKMRPLGLPTFTDKLVQEVLRMILEAVYEPIFLDCSHGFRPNRSCHTALRKFKYQFNGTKWFIEGDIENCFDSINHSKLIEFINAKIKDARIIKLIGKLLKSGYVDNWEYYKTHSGCPQGSICSPIFANIYLHELDKYITMLQENFEQPTKSKITDCYRVTQNKIKSVNLKVEKSEGYQRSKLIKQKRILRQQKLKLPYKLQTSKRLKYIRYADDFIIGINGNKEDCQKLKQQLTEFVNGTMKMKLSNEKTLITHSNTYARFLGYDIRVRRDNKIKRGGVNNCTKRTLNNTSELSIPLKDEIMKFLFENKIVWKKRSGEIMPIRRLNLMNCTDIEIVSTYNAELRGICNYYSIASNFHKLNYFSYLMEYSCLLTLCSKYKSTISKIKTKYGEKGEWRIPYKTKTGMKYCYFADFRECKNKYNHPNDKKFDLATKNTPRRTTFESRLTANLCELCKTTNAEHYEIHHVPKLKDLTGKKEWEQLMIKKRRKTLIVCESCHKMIHNK